MSAEIVLSRASLRAIRDGATVSADASDGKVVNLSTMALAGAGRFQVVLSAADLALIEHDPAGQVCGAVTGGTGWTVRVAS